MAMVMRRARAASWAALVAGCTGKAAESNADGVPAQRAVADETPRESARVAGETGVPDEVPKSPVPPPDAAACALAETLAGEWSFRTHTLGGSLADSIMASGEFTMTVAVKDCVATASLHRLAAGRAFEEPSVWIGADRPRASAPLMFIDDDEGKAALLHGHFELRAPTAKRPEKGSEVDNNFAFVVHEGHLFGYWSRAGDKRTLLGTLHGIPGNTAPSDHAVADQPCAVQCMLACRNLEHGEDSLQQADPADCLTGCRAGKVAVCGAETERPDTLEVEMTGPFRDASAACEHIEDQMREAHAIGDVPVACDDRPMIGLLEEDRRTINGVAAGPGAGWRRGTLFSAYAKNGQGREPYYLGVQTELGWFVGGPVDEQTPASAAGRERELVSIGFVTAPLADAPGDELYVTWKANQQNAEGGRGAEHYAAMCAVRDNRPRCIQLETRWPGGAVHLTVLPTGRIAVDVRGGAGHSQGLVDTVYRWGG